MQLLQGRHLVSGQRHAQHQKGIDPLAQQLRVQDAAIGLVGTTYVVEQDVVLVLDENLLSTVDERGEEPPAEPGHHNPTVWVRPVGSPAALGEGTYPSSAAADRTTSRVAAATPQRTQHRGDRHPGLGGDVGDAAHRCAPRPPPLTLHAPREQSADEVPLQGEEHDDRDDDRDECAGRQQMPVAATVAL